MSKFIIKALIRQAKKTEDPVATLEDIQAGRFNVLSEDGILTCTGINGKAFSLTIPSGLSTKDVMVLSEVALTHLERGTLPSNEALGRVR